MAAEAQPTIRRLAATVEAIEQQVQEILGSLEGMQAAGTGTVAAIEQQIRVISGALDDMQAARGVESERIWTALAGLAGLDGIAAGMADIGELLGPLRQLVPPSTALPLDSGVPRALQVMRAALGFPGRGTDSPMAISTGWDLPVGFIGQVSGTDDPDPYQEQVI